MKNLKITTQNPWLEDKHPTEITSIAVEVLNGISKKEPEYSKGRKLRTDFVITGTEDVCISQIYEDRFDENGNLVGTNMRIEWYDDRGNPALFKNVYTPLSIQEVSETITSRRKRQINYLQEAGKRMGVKQYIDMLFGYYSAQVISGKTVNLINSYIENGNKDFQNVLNNETNTQILQILGAKLPDNKTVKESILYQIT